MRGVGDVELWRVLTNHCDKTNYIGAKYDEVERSAESKTGNFDTNMGAMDIVNGAANYGRKSP